ncbi:hypothetical protein [Persephonella sp.]
MDKPLTVWYCDVCGEKIYLDGGSGRLEPEETGMVQWETDENFKAYNFKITHKRCDLKYPSWFSLENSIGNKGKAFLLSFLNPGPIKERLYGRKIVEPKVKDFSEFFDLFHRVQTPYYEETRKYFNCPDVIELLSDADEIYPYLPETLKEIIERFNDICE